MKDLCLTCKKNEAQIHGLCSECCVCCQDQDPPMGVSEWKEHGKKYGYWDFFKEDIKKMIEDTAIIEKGFFACESCGGAKHALKDILKKLKEL